MTAAVDKPITPPFRQRVRRWRESYIPFLVWIGAVGVVTLLLERQTRVVNAVGVLEVRHVSVAALQDGIIQSLNVDIFDSVEAGQAIALMDDTALRAELMVAESELEHLRSSLSAERARLARDEALRQVEELEEFRQFAMDEEEARLGVLERVVEYEAGQVNLQRLGMLLQRQERLMEDQVLDMLTYEDTLMRYETLKTRLEESEKDLEEARAHLDRTIERRAERSAVETDTEWESWLEPYRAAIRTQEHRIAGIAERRQYLVLRAPIAGKVTQVLRRMGETTLAGDPLVMIADPTSTRVVAYVNEAMIQDVQVGRSVELIPARDPQTAFIATILKTSSSIEEYPPRLQRSPMFTQWGLPILIGDLPPGDFFPGERFEIRFLDVH